MTSAPIRAERDTRPVSQLQVAEEIRAAKKTLHRPTPDSEVRVLLGRQKSQGLVRGLDMQIGLQGALAGTSDARVVCDSEHDEVRIAVTALTGKLSGQKRTMRLPKRAHFLSPSGYVLWNGQVVRGELTVVARSDRGGSNQCLWVNTLYLEKYLEGVVNGEIRSDWPEAAVDAQIIAARSYAIAQIRPSLPDFDLESTVQDQVYAGFRSEDRRTAQAVRRTAGQVLVDRHSRSLLKAFYHSSCGGLTELPEAVWGSKHAGFRRRVVCPYCRGAPGESWSLRLAAQEVLAAFAEKLRSGGLSLYASLPFRLESLVRRMDSSSHRARELELALQAVGAADMRSAQQRSLETSHHRQARSKSMRANEPQALWKGRSPAVLPVSEGQGERVVLPVSAQEFRLRLGPKRFPSTKFDVQLERDARTRAVKSLVFQGRGFGHGVGLCQWGAKRMAEQGSRARQILAHYYPDAEVERWSPGLW